MRRTWILCVLCMVLAAGWTAHGDGSVLGPTAEVARAGVLGSSSEAHHRERADATASQTFLAGNDAVEPHSELVRPGRAVAFRFKAAAAGAARSVNVYLDAGNRAKRLVAGIYGDHKGRPGVLLRAGSLSALGKAAWNKVTLKPRGLKANRDYWIAVLGIGGTLSLRDRFGKACRSVASLNSSLRRLPSSWKTGRASRTCSISAYAGGIARPTGATPPTGAPTTGAPSAGAPTPADCASATSNIPDGPDPWGGCFPGPSSTGVPVGTTLTPYTGSCNVTTSNVVIDAKTINCDPLTIAASNVQITRSRVNGEVSIDSYPNSYSFAISDSEVIANSTSTGANDGATGIGKSNFTAIRDNVHGGIRAVWCEFNCTVKDSWLHGQLTDQSGAAHESGVRMGENSTITHNSIICEAPDVPPDAGCSADLTGYGDFEVIEDNTISSNLFEATPGGTCAYGGSTPNKPYSSGVNHIVFQSNIFQHRNSVENSGHCGYWFAISDFDSNAPGNQWINNRWDDGKVVAPNG
jgi:hypothetical protein